MPYINHLIAASLVGLSGTPVQAATLFSESFDLEFPGSVFNYTSFSQFTVSDGTVDLIASGGYSISCVGGTGLCVDLDGSTSDSGRMTSDAFSLTTTQDITLSFSVSGNQRGQSDDELTFGFLFGGTEYSDSATLSASDPFSTLTYTLFGAEAGDYSIFFENSGGDNFGTILDDVLVSSGETVSPIPLPASVPLLLAGLGGLAIAGRRRPSHAS